MEAEKKPKQSFKTVVLDPMGGITHERICKELNSVDYVEIGVVAGAGTSRVYSRNGEKLIVLRLS